MIVVDSSALARALVVDGADGDRARERLRADRDLHAPHVIDLEVTSALRFLVRDGTLTARRAGTALADLADLTLTRYSHVLLLERVWELRDNLTPYDAAFVALAEALDAVLVTADRRLAGAPRVRCAIDVL